MKKSRTPATILYRLIIGILAILLLVSTVFWGQLPEGWIILLIVVFIALVSSFPLNQSIFPISFAHIIVIGSGILYGPEAASWGAVLGISISTLIRHAEGIWRGRRSINSSLSILLEVVYSVGFQIIPLFFALAFMGWVGGLRNISEASYIDPYVLIPIFLFGLFQSVFFAIDYLLHSHQPAYSLDNLLFLFAAVELTPLPFVYIAVMAYPEIGIGSLISFSAIPAILALFISSLNSTRADSERRLQELATINQISQVLRSTLDIESLLNVILVQVTQLLNVDNFYVALYESNEQHIWYPLAVKHGQRQKWQRRPLMPDRLTDRVIRDGKPVLLTVHTPEEKERIGLPTSEESPSSWLGVPLITPQKTTGCLAVFSVAPGVEFTHNDLELLTILSGQVSVAIENALVYNQANRRASQLETLNRISTLITASLDPNEVFSQVCRSVAEVANGQHSAIFLLDTEKGLVSLAYSFGLSLEFTSLQDNLSLAHYDRLRCLRTGRPVLVPTLDNSAIDIEYASLLEKEEIHAYGEFPLVTPDGRIGFLGVYFDSAHLFLPEEVELLQTFASQAALAVSNARQYAHTDMALTRRVYQLSILESVGRELAAAISSDRLFEMILNYALEFTNSPWGELGLYNRKTRILEVKAARGYGNGRSEFSVKEGLAGKAVSTQQPVYVGDIKSEPGYIDLTGGASRSKLCLPLINEGRVLGVISLESDRPNAYSSNDQAFISQLATQAAVAVVNAELYSETQRRLREQSILYLISSHLVGNPSLEVTLQTLARSMEAVLQNCSIAVYLWEERKQLFISHYDMKSTTLLDCQLPANIPAADLEAVLPPLSKTGPLNIASPRNRKLLGNCRDCQELIFPLVANQQRIGIVFMHVQKDRAVSEDELQLMRAITAQSSISLQNAILYLDLTSGRDRMAAVLNSVGEGIVMVDTSGNIVLANEFIYKITGCRPEDLLNQDIASLPENALRVLGYTRPEAESLGQSTQQGQAAGLIKATIKVSDNKPEKVMERLTYPVWSHGGQVIGSLIVLRDVTEEHQIADAREMITETLVHDLRSPVSAVLSAIDVIVDVQPSDFHDEVIEQALRVARNGATRVLALIESLLDIARMQSGKMDLILTPLHIQTIAAGCLAEFSAQAKGYQIQLVNEIPDSLPMINADQGKITRVISNLLDNALKFTPPEGTIRIAAELTPRDEINIEVSDTGPGIPEEFREKIFDRFTQVPSQHGRRRGSGLGLTFCKMAVEAHGGRIWVESPRPPEKGSIFIFSLPISGTNLGGD